MKATFKVLSDDERTRVHEESLNLLGKTGVRVDTALGRNILKDAGAEVDASSNIVRFPRQFVEDCLRMVPKEVTLGARKPGADLPLNGEDCTLCLDGEGPFVLDRHSGKRRKATYNDWKEITRVADALDEIGVYWCQVEAGNKGEKLGEAVQYLCDVQRYFTKHVQDTIFHPSHAPWLFEILQIIHGSTADIQKNHPMSTLVCPQSPLIIDQEYTDAYLALKGLNMPVGIMPMPLMGATAPASMIATIVQGNCEVLSMLCLIQAHEPGVPVIYAPALALMDPRTGGLRNAGMQYAVMGAAATEMARYYNLPAESCPGGSDAHQLDIQMGLEGAAMSLPTMLSWPDIIVGPGMLDGSMVASLEQLVIEVEIFRLAKQAHRGVVTDQQNWLVDVIDDVGPGGHFLSESSTLSAIRSDEWYLSDLGFHGSFEDWLAQGEEPLAATVNKKLDDILASHASLPLDESVENELYKICKRARACA